jgi:hypothetical protein
MAHCTEHNMLVSFGSLRVWSLFWGISFAVISISLYKLLTFRYHDGVISIHLFIRLLGSGTIMMDKTKYNLLPPRQFGLVIKILMK